MPKTMNEIVAHLVVNTNLPEKSVRAVVRSFVDLVQAELTTEAGYVTVTGLGTFRSVKKGDRHARNPSNGDKVWVEGYLKPTFKGSTALCDSINGKSSQS